MLGYLKRGVQRLAEGVSGPLRGDHSGALVVQHAHARFQEAVLQGNVWIGSNPSGTAVTTQAGVSATTPALVLFNPINSRVNLVPWYVQFGITAAPAAASVMMLAFNAPQLAGVPTGPATVTAANITNAILSRGITGAATVLRGQGAEGQCYAVSTLSAAPVAFNYPLGTTGAAAISGVSMHHWIDGSFIIPPGVAVSVQTSSAAALICAFCWAEEPVM